MAKKQHQQRDELEIKRLQADLKALEKQDKEIKEKRNAEESLDNKETLKTLPLPITSSGGGYFSYCVVM